MKKKKKKHKERAFGELKRSNAVVGGGTGASIPLIASSFTNKYKTHTPYTLFLPFASLALSLSSSNFCLVLFTTLPFSSYSFFRFHFRPSHSTISYNCFVHFWFLQQVSAPSRFSFSNPIRLATKFRCHIFTERRLLGFIYFI